MKTYRQKKILEIISTRIINTQDEIVDLLTKEGINVTQATVSRDIRELNITKVLEKGIFRYTAPSVPEWDLEKKYDRVLRDGYVSMDMAQNILVIKTVAGMAMAVAAALDAMKWSEIVGTIAGDDTIMCAIRTVEDTHRLMEKIHKAVKK